MADSSKGLGNVNFSGLGGAVNDIFGGIAAKTSADLKAQGLNISASGTRIQAQSQIIGAEGTELSAESLRTKAQGDLAEASNYDLAALLARNNETFTNESTAIQQAQQDRSLFMSMGSARAAAAAGGGTLGGSTADILRDSASQGALAKAVLTQQGLITAMGYEEEAKSFDTMSSASRAAAAGEQDIASKTDTIAGQQRDIATQTLGIANQTDALADQTRAAGSTAEMGDFISGAIKTVGAFAAFL